MAGVDDGDGADDGNTMPCAGSDLQTQIEQDDKAEPLPFSCTEAVTLVVGPSSSAGNAIQVAAVTTAAI